MKPENNYYITTAIAYTSRKPHIGNSYEIVLTDAIARYQRLNGKNVFSRPALTNTARRSRNWRARRASPPKPMWTGWRERSNPCGI